MSCCCSPLGPAGAGAGLSNVFWVDGNAPVNGSGTDESPFNTLVAGAAAIAALVITTGGVLLVTPGDYSAETIAVDGLTIAIDAFGTAAEPAAVPQGPQVLIGGITATVTAASVYLRGCHVQSFDLGNSDVECDVSTIESSTGNAGSVLVMRGSGNRGTLIAPFYSGTMFGSLNLTNMRAGSIVAGQLQADGCYMGSGGTITADACTFRACNWDTTAGAITSASISMDRASERSYALAGGKPVSLPIPLEPINPIYGTGATGNVTQNASTNLANDAEYDNLTFVANGRLTLQANILRVRNLLSLAAAHDFAGFGAIRDWAGGTGADGVGSTGGGAWGGTGGYPTGNSGTLQAPSGANGTTAAGAQPTNVPTLVAGYGGKGGGGGAGGKGTAAGGAARAAAAITNERTDCHWPLSFVGPTSATSAGSVVTAPVPIMGGHVGQAGSAGGGDTVAGKGGGGGGAGRGGGSVGVFARGIEVGKGTPSGTIASRAMPGGKGGKGDAGATACGGGGGAAGGGGGDIIIGYDWIIGDGEPADVLNANGADGGTGGDGDGAGAPGDGGDGGDGGAGGQIVLWNLLTNVRTVIKGTAGTAGAAHSGATGGKGGTAGTCTGSFP